MEDIDDNLTMKDRGKTLSMLKIRSKFAAGHSPRYACPYSSCSERRKIGRRRWLT